MLCLIKALDALHVRSAKEFSVQTVSPRVIRALERLTQLAGSFFANPRPAVAADIVESALFPAVIAQNDQTFPHDLRDKIIAWPRYLALVPHAQPLNGKNTLL